MSSRDPVDRLAEEFAARLRNGESPSIAGYVKNHPEYAEQIQSTFPTIALMERLASEEAALTSSAAKKQDVETPKELGGFRIVSELGRGGMGVVYEAEQVSLSRHVALKVLPSQWLATPNQRKRFEREARAAARLHHTNIIPVFGVGEDHGTHFYAMQYIGGRSLDEVLRQLKQENSGQSATRHTRLHHLDSGSADDSTRPHKISDSTDADIASAKTAELGSSVTVDSNLVQDVATSQAQVGSPDNYWHQVAAIGIQIADALEYAHSQGILHRDIKPSNLLVDAQGCVWVADFGLAIFDDEVKITETGDIVGTLQYLAPERFDGIADARSDIYSLGLTLYELLALRPAFDARNRKTLIKQILETEPPRLRKLNRNVPRDLETIIQKAIERSVENRIQSAGDLAADLRRFVEDQPIRSRRVSAAERFWRWCRRNPGISWTTATAAVLLISTIATAFVLINNERKTALQLAEEKSRLAEEKSALAINFEAQAKSLANVVRQKEQIAIDERKATMREHSARTRLQSMLSSETELRTQAEMSRQLSEQLAAESKAVTDFLLVDMIGAATPQRTQGRPITMQVMLDNAAARVEHAFEDQPTVEAAVRNTIGSAFYTLGQYDKAKQQLEVALKLRKKHLGKESPDTLGTALNLSAVQFALGEIDNARTLELETYTLLHSAVGPTDPRTLDALNNFAAKLHAQGKYPDAKKHFETVLDRRREHLGAEDPKTLSTAANLAMTLDALGDVVEAGKLHQTTANTRLRILGSDHPSTLTSLGNLAANLDNRKKHKEAEVIHRQVVTSRRRVLGADHPNTLAAINNFAVNLQNQNKLEDSRELYVELLEEYRRKLGARHPSTLTVMNNLATNLQNLKQYDKAEVLYREVHATLKMALGVHHPSTLTVLENLGYCLDFSEKYSEAETAFREVFAGRRQILGNRHPQTLVAIHALGKVLLAQKKHKAAETLLRESLKDHQSQFPEGHWLTASAQSLLGESLIGLGQLEKAEPMVLDGYRGMKAQRGHFKPRLIEQAARRIVKLYEVWNKPAEAERWKRELNQ